MTAFKVGTREEWQAARDELLRREKELTRMGDELARQRRELPWVPVDRQYILQTSGGPRSLVELFDGRSQLAVYHFMFGPSYEAGCPTCSSMADGLDALLPHLRARDVTLICVSGAPIEKLLAFRERMGWRFTWASSSGSDFNADMGFSSSLQQTRAWVPQMLDKLPAIASRNAGETGTDVAGYLTEGFGFSVFAVDAGTVYQTYSTTNRGVEFLMGYYGVLDRMPRGRDEGDAWQTWIHRHDEYDRE